MITTIIFDMNGVIIDDEHIHELAFRETVRPYGIQLNHSDYLVCCAGKTDRAGYEQIAHTFGKDLPIDNLLREKSQQYLELFPTNKKSYPGVIKLIHSLASHYQLALTSSSSRAEVDLITREFGISSLFQLTISGNDVQHGKPDPEPYLLTISKLGISPKDCLVIEDSRSGVHSAKAAGCYCVGITTTHSHHDLRDADLVIDAFAEITPEFIENATTPN